MENVPQEWKRAMGWWLIIFLAAVLLALLGCEAPAQVVEYTRAPLEGYDAITNCTESNNIVVIVANHVQDTAQFRIVLLHENVHVKQILSYEGKCQDFIKHFNENRFFAFKMEAEAYCVSLRQLQKEGKVRGGEDKLAIYLRANYAPWLPLELVYNLLPCGGSNGRPSQVQADGTYNLPRQGARQAWTDSLYRLPRW